jgi:hypothetical protein
MGPDILRITALGDEANEVLNSSQLFYYATFRISCGIYEASTPFYGEYIGRLSASVDRREFAERVCEVIHGRTDSHS